MFGAGITDKVGEVGWATTRDWNSILESPVESSTNHKACSFKSTEQSLVFDMPYQNIGYNKIYIAILQMLIQMAPGLHYSAPQSHRNRFGQVQSQHSNLILNLSSLRRCRLLGLLIALVFERVFGAEERLSKASLWPGHHPPLQLL